MSEPKVSVVSIARSVDEFKPIQICLEKQTFRDFEFIGEAGGTIPSAWNRAIAKTKGEIIVFTETDAMPVNEHWLEELVGSIPDGNTVVKGLEVSMHEWNMSNLAAHREVFLGVKFDEQFLWAEDTEFYCQLKQKGNRFYQLNQAPVIHLRNFRSRRMIRRAFRYGLYWAKIRQRYADPVEVASIVTVSRNIIMSVIQLVGLIVGSVIYWPERLHRSKKNDQR